MKPRIRPINQQVAEFIKNYPPEDIEKSNVDKALDIIRSPWERRDEKDLREWFDINDPEPKVELPRDITF